MQEMLYRFCSSYPPCKSPGIMCIMINLSDQFSFINHLALCRPTFIKIWKDKRVMQFKPDPYVVTALNCAVWVFYGMPFVHPDSLLVVTINGIGLVIELIYVTIFFIYAEWQKRVRTQNIFLVNSNIVFQT